MTQWTETQARAISLRGCNLLVAAAAGSGKTAVLVERVLQLLIQDKVDIDRLLVVTFTKAAAGEMRERISAALLEALGDWGESTVHIRRQLSLLNRASISTLHAFCTDVLRRHFHLVDIDPGFRVADQNEADVLRLEILDELMEQEYEQSDPRFLDLVEAFGGSKSDLGLQELIQKTYDFMQSQPDSCQWLRSRVEDYTLNERDLADSLWVRTVLQEAAVQIQAACQRFQMAQQLCLRPGGPITYQKALYSDISICESLEKALGQGLEALAEACAGFKHPTLARAPREVDSTLQQAVKDLREEGKGLLKDLAAGSFSKSMAEWTRELNDLYPLMDYLAQLVIELSERFRARKNEKGLVDFHDLEHFALEILREPSVAGEYRAKYQYLFVDEYQDSNLVQETLLQCIARDENLFMVGDVKQSIYRFRLADPTLFLQKSEEYRLDGDSLYRRVDLKMNFRSQPGIIEAVNRLFEQVMSRHVGEIDYDESASLYCGLEWPETARETVQVTLVNKQGQSRPMADDDEGDDPGDVGREALVAARHIQAMVGQQFYDAKIGCSRPLEYRDIVVLLRTTRAWTGEFMEVFSAQGIPTYADVSSGYFNTVEVELILNLLKLIDNRRQDLPLLSVMRSTLFGFSSGDLVAIRIFQPESPYYTALEDYPAVHQDQLAVRLQILLDRLDAWREEARGMPVDQFIWKVLRDTGYYYYAGALPGGIQRQANLRILMERARQFENSSLKGLFNFIKYIERLIKSSGDMEMAKVLGENDNVVRIMSIHKSKGLEFPVVIMAGLGKRFNLSDSSARVLFHKDLGIGTRYVNVAKRRYADTIARIAMKNRLRLENLAEEMRILYVAMTRPQSRLVLVGTLGDLQTAAVRWARPLGQYELSRARSFLDWLGPVWIRSHAGAALRDLADEGLSIDENQTPLWNIDVVTASDVAGIQRQQQQARAEVLASLAACREPDADGQPVSLDQQWGWEYPHQASISLPSKLSVTQLKGQADTEDGIQQAIPSLIERPIFLKRGSSGDQISLTAMQKGTAMHYVMQHLVYSQVQTLQDIATQVERMVDQEMLAAEEAAVVDISRILSFLDSPLGHRIQGAQVVRREAAFNLLVKAADVLPSKGALNERILVQGVIDLFFEESDGLVVVDYKTDRVTAANRDQLVDNYRSQVAMYCQALAAIEGRPVKEGFLHFFLSGETIRVFP